MTDSFGARLRHERERRQIALKSIADSTKISLPLLEGLEHDNVTRWPSGIFRKAFLRSYAQAIGVDPEPVLREFEELYPDPVPPAGVAQEPPGPIATAPSNVETHWQRALAGARERSRGWTRMRRPQILQRPVIVKLTISAPVAAFTRRKLLADVRKRWAAAAYDAGVSCIIAVAFFPVVGHFWTPLGVSMLCYYFGGILILGNTPGVCLFAPADDPGLSGASSKT